MNPRLYFGHNLIKKAS